VHNPIEPSAIRIAFSLRLQGVFIWIPECTRTEHKEKESVKELKRIVTQGPAHLALGELAGLFASRRELTDSERATHAGDFARIRDETGLLRCWEEGRIIGVTDDRYDPMLMDACSPAWIPAPRVVGTAMGRCGERNAMRDLYLDQPVAGPDRLRMRRGRRAATPAA